jgi:hypothetical protein
MAEDRSARLVRVLAAAWEAIRVRHPEVPAVVIVIGAGSVGARRGELRLGHFAATRWREGTGAGSVALAEVFVGGEGLAQGAPSVLDTLLHEAAHALAHVRGVQDTSRQGRYHNKRYAALARELGLDVREAQSIGWSDTSLTPATAEAYQDTIDDLVPALTLWRLSENQLHPGDNSEGDAQDDDAAGDGGRPKDRNLRPCVCSCGRRIRAAAGTLAAGPILCGMCAQPFQLSVT